MKSKALVYKVEHGWKWRHHCRKLLDIGGPVIVDSRLYTEHRHAFIAAWWHAKACLGVRQYPESKERT